MRRIAIHRSLHRADLIMGIERDLLFPIGIAAGVLIVSSGNRPWQILIGLIILSGGVALRITSYNVCYTKLLRNSAHDNKTNKQYPGHDGVAVYGQHHGRIFRDKI